MNVSAQGVLGDNADFAVAFAWRLPCGCAALRSIRTYHAERISFEDASKSLMRLMLLGADIPHTCDKPYEIERLVDDSELTPFP